MRRTTNRMATAIAVTVVTLCLAACGRGEVGRAGRAALATDAFGCPDLDGAYRVSLPPQRRGSQAGALDEALRKPDGSQVPIEQIHAVDIRRTAPGTYRFDWLIDEGRVRQHLGVIREFEKPRYRRWYHLLGEQDRAAHVAAHGQADYEDVLAGLGPDTTLRRQLRATVDVTCSGGWLELPKGELRAMRLTRGEDGSVIGEFRGLKAVGITVWCGDGCRDVPIPTGTFTGRIHWPRDDGLRAWHPAAQGGQAAFERPMDEIEAEVAARMETQRRADEHRYLPEATIRARIEALAPPGTVVETVEVRDGKVRIRYEAPKGEVDTLLGRIAGASGDPDAPQEVVHGVRSTAMSRRFVVFVLTDSPLVLRDADAAPASASASATTVPTLLPAGDGQVASSPSSPGSGASRPPADLVVLTPASASTDRSARPQATPSGLPEPDAIRRRVAGLMPAGCRVVDVRYGGERVTVTGEADGSRCISDTLRALDGIGAQPELVETAMDGAGRRRFRMLLRAAPLGSK